MADPRHQLVAAGHLLDQREVGLLEFLGPLAFALQRLGELRDDGRRDRRGEHGPPRRGLRDRVEDVVAVGVLRDVARRPRHEHLANRFVVLLRGQRNHADVRVALLDTAGGLDAVHVRHAHVHQHDVRLDVPGDVEGLAPGRGLAGYLQARRDEQGHERLPEPVVVVDHHDAGRVGGGGDDVGLAGEQDRGHGRTPARGVGARIPVRGKVVHPRKSRPSGGSGISGERTNSQDE